MRGSNRDNYYGYPINPLDIIIEPRGPGDLPSATLSQRLRRTITNGRMRRMGRSVPVSRRAWYTTLIAIAADEQRDFKPGQLVRGMSFEPQRFWVHSRRISSSWVSRDHAAGGRGSAFAVEYRLCRVCGRVLLAQQAHDYREMDRWPQRSWHYPQGPACSVDCAPPAIIRNSKHRQRITNQGAISNEQ